MPVHKGMQRFNSVPKRAPDREPSTMKINSANRSCGWASRQFAAAVTITAVAISSLAGAPASHALALAQGPAVACPGGEFDGCASVAAVPKQARECADSGSARAARGCEQSAVAGVRAIPKAGVHKSARLHP